MLDIETLRFTFGVLSLLVLILFYAGVYRPTRSRFAGWWSLALLCAALSPSLLLFNGTDVQVVANPLSSAITVLGGSFVWFATRSIRGLPALRWVSYSIPLVVLMVAYLGNPATNRWAGNWLLFLTMSVFFSFAARDMWMAWHARRASPDWTHDGEARVALIVNALASTILAVFYVWRTIIYLITGPEGVVFTTTVGGGPTAVVLMLTLVAVTFSGAALGYDQQTQELRRRVALDDLTGLYARSAFFERVGTTIAHPCSSGLERLFVVADLDHFKAINDVHGHAAGDRALEIFADAVTDALREGELAGRLGGEEFAMLLCETSVEEVPTRLANLGVSFAKSGALHNVDVPTVSFGVAPAPGDVPVAKSLARADAAMYKAKVGGRNRVVVVEAYQGVRSGDG